MAEQMLFPKTWEEFEKQYGFHDSKQAYMYGNTRLIPSFRVEQWLDHIDNIKRKKQPQKNKMAEVVKMFGKKLNERFTISYLGRRFCCEFDEYGIDVYDEPPFAVCFNEQILYALLTGEAMIVDD